MDGHASGMGDEMSCEYCEPYSRVESDMRERGTGFVLAIDSAMSPPKLVAEFDSEGCMVEYAMESIRFCPYCGRDLEEE